MKHEAKIKRAVKTKIFLQRSATYFALFNSTGIFYLVAKEHLPFWALPFAWLFGVCLMLCIGYLDYRFVVQREQELFFDKIPQIEKLIKLLEKDDSQSDS